jgi:hypothetical protein
MPPLAIAAGISGISSIAGAALNHGQKTTQEQVPYYTPAQDAVQSQLGQIIQALMNKGDNGKLTKGMRNVGRTTINQNFNNMQARSEAQATARGFGPGSSGKAMYNNRQMDVARGQQFTELDNTLAEQEWMRRMGVLNMGLQFSRPLGSTTTTSTPGPGIGSTIANVGGDIGSLIAMSQFLH